MAWMIIAAFVLALIPIRWRHGSQYVLGGAIAFSFLLLMMGMTHVASRFGDAYSTSLARYFAVCASIAIVIELLGQRRFSGLIVGSLLFTFGALELGLIHQQPEWLLRMTVLMFFFSYALVIYWFVEADAPSTPRDILMLALWCATSLSLLMLGWRIFRYLAFGPQKLITLPDAYKYLPINVFWVIPSMVFAGFFLLAMVLMIAAYLFPRLISYRWIAFVFSFFFILDLFPTLLDTIPLPISLTVVITAILSLAMEAQLVQRRERLGGLLHSRSGTLLITATLLLAIGVPTTDYVARARRMASLVAPPKNKTNVLLIVLDTARRESFSLYQYGRDTTPLLRSWSQKGILYSNAICTSSWTLPSHASMFTGRWCFEHRASFLDPLDGYYPTLAEALERQGYLTAGFVGNIGNCGSHTGLGRGFQHYQDYLATEQLYLRISSALGFLYKSDDTPLSRTAENVSDEFFDWLSSSDPNRPFFAFINFLDPHFPYKVVDPAFDIYSPQPAQIRSHFRDLWEEATFRYDNIADPLELDVAIDTYDGSIAYLDYQVDRLLTNLQAQGKLDNTLVIITSDHGEHFGEHGCFWHGTSLYRQLIDAPLLILLPKGTGAGQVIDLPVSLRSLPKTILEQLGLPEHEHFPGVSIAKRNESTGQIEASAESILSELGQSVNIGGQLNSAGGLVSLIDEGYHYLLNHGENMEKLFAFADRGDTLDLSGQKPEVIKSSRERLAQVLRMPQGAGPQDATDPAAISGGTRRPLDQRTPQ